MQRRSLGATGLELSILGFGGAPLGDEYGTVDEAEGQTAVHAALDAGINYFDVAPYYGRGLAEKRLGRFLEGRRDEAVISTKCARYDKRGFDFSAERIERSIDESLGRLRTDRVDLFLVHDVEFGTKRQVLEESLPALERIRKAGKARAIGVTGLPVHLLAELAREFTGVDVVLSYCHQNLLARDFVPTFEDLLATRPLGLINASPLHMGILSPSGPPPWHPAPPEVLSAGRELANWCQEHGRSLPTEALRFALRDARVASTLVGVRTPAELQENLTALEAAPVEGEAEWQAALAAIASPVLGLTWHEGLPENAPPSLQ